MKLSGCLPFVTVNRVTDEQIHHLSVNQSMTAGGLAGWCWLMKNNLFVIITVFDSWTLTVDSLLLYADVQVHNRINPCDRCVCVCVCVFGDRILLPQPPPPPTIHVY